MKILTLAIIVISLFLISSCTIKPPMPYEDVGVAVGTSGSLYSCLSRNLIKSCDTISSTGKTCYYFENNVKKSMICTDGWKLQSQPQPSPVIVPNPQGNYHCYPEKGYCRLNGLLTNPAVPIGQIK